MSNNASDYQTFSKSRYHLKSVKFTIIHMTPVTLLIESRFVYSRKRFACILVILSAKQKINMVEMEEDCNHVATWKRRRNAIPLDIR